jgi:hypothetical protein
MDWRRNAASPIIYAMSKKNQSAHRVNVAEASGHADTIICVSYDLDEASSFRGFEYFKLLTAIDSQGLSIPCHRQATFKEELRVLDRAAYADNNDGDIVERIRKRVATAYDSSVKITITAIQ